MKNHILFFGKILIPVFLLFSSINTLKAITVTFNNNSGDNLWSNPANWSPASIPGSGDDVIISLGSLIIDVKIDVKSLTISNTAAVSFTHTGIAKIEDLTISGGTLTSTTKIMISNGLSWTGTSSLTSSSSIELSVSSTNVISGGGNRNLYAQLVNKGTLTHTGGSLRFQTGGAIENIGIFTTDGATFFINTGGGAFTNKGIFNKNNALDLNMFVVFDQAGTGILNVNEGAFKYLSGGSSIENSTVNIASGGSVIISSGIYTFGSGTSIGGAGDFEISGGTTTFDGAFAMSGETKIIGGTVDFNNTSTTTFSDLSFSGGTIEGGGKLLINDNFKWTGTANMKSTDTITLASTANSLFFTNGSRNLYSVMINNGTLNHSAGNLRLYPGGSFDNNGTYNLSGPSIVYDNGGGSFNNNGVFEHQASGTINFQPDFKNNINGIITGKGTMAFTNLSNLGTFAVNDTDGTLNITGSYVNGNTLEVNFNNSDHGDLKVSGNILLSGTLDVNISGMISPGTYPIISTTSGTISGTFDTENIPTNFSLVYGASEVNLQVNLLPVELTKFSASVQVKNIKLDWQTASEVNSKNFIVEHSQDGINFRAIGDVAAAGSSETIRNYQFIHETPTNGTNYYKLRQQDIDGKFEYSDLRVLSFYNFDNELSVFPNPSHGSVIIKNKSDKTLKLSVIDLHGKVVYVRNEVTSGAISLDLSHLPKGMYTLDFSNYGYFTHQEKLMILE